MVAFRIIPIRVAQPMSCKIRAREVGEGRLIDVLFVAVPDFVTFPPPRCVPVVRQSKVRDVDDRVLS